MLQKEFGERDLDLDFDYRVFNGNLATKVGSDRYTNLEGVDKYSMPLFDDACVGGPCSMKDTISLSIVSSIRLGAGFCFWAMALLLSVGVQDARR